jgi:hypothetical protein
MMQYVVYSRNMSIIKEPQRQGHNQKGEGTMKAVGCVRVSTENQAKPDEQEAIRLIREHHTSGMGCNAIAGALSGKGMKTGTGRDFQATQVMRVLAA